MRIFQNLPDLPARFDPAISVTIEAPCGKTGELDTPLTDKDLRNALQRLQTHQILKVVNETTCEVHDSGLYKLRYYCTQSGTGTVDDRLQSYEVSLWVVPS